MPAEVMGLNFVSDAGNTLSVVEQEKQARDIIEYRNQRKLIMKNTIHKRGSLEELFMQSGSGRIKELPIIIKYYQSRCSRFN